VCVGSSLSVSVSMSVSVSVSMFVCTSMSVFVCMSVSMSVSVCGYIVHRLPFIIALTHALARTPTVHVQTATQCYRMSVSVCGYIMYVYVCVYVWL